MNRDMHNTIAPLRILRYRELHDDLNLIPNRVTLARWVAAGNFPAPVRLGPNSVGWLASDIEAWLASRAAERER